ncbi:hypothetical protein DES53_101698 [Roseimicrobium gellanilyticum]|uniref:Uncharacterized protein n=1 Tax=Roseimicrobium gellanilyticum TaxID=748857 RepID=A0A366HX60_9BACT|nr:hypothetical protein [Roseimicrobium gellanilyticum]RBP47898.1 hypothetical protein DES53_101698 [Roseimicrobium gellanilyticum]
MSEAEPIRRTKSQLRKEARQKKMPKWLAWLIMALFVFLTGVLLWFGLAIVVQCDRAADGTVYVTVQRKLLRWIPITSESLPDVITAKGEFVKSTTQSGVTRRSNTSERLVLISKNGSEWQSPLYTPSLGTRPKTMAAEINAFIQNTTASSPSTFTTWWMPWLVNLASLPFILVSLISLCALGEVLLRWLGYIKDEPPTT